jgi:hypothetical protein
MYRHMQKVGKLLSPAPRTGEDQRPLASYRFRDGVECLTDVTVGAD